MKKLRLNIAGAFIYFDKLLPLILKTKLHKQFNLTVYDSVDFCPWNGGRINYKNNASKKKVETYNKYNIAVGVTFTNFHINLNDKLGNNFLNILSESQRKFLKNKKNEIFLINEKFRQYLRENYNFLLKFSIIGHYDWLTNDPDINQAIEFYKNLEYKYDLIVPKRVYVDKKWFYENLNIKKYEILYNYDCKYDCKFFYSHFKQISLQNLKENNNIDYNIDKCWITNQKPIQIDMSNDYLKKLLKLGYKNFKIAGRDTNFNELKHDLFYFISQLEKLKVQRNY